MALTTHPHLALRLKKEYSYTCTPVWAFVACSRVNCTFYLCIYCVGLNLVLRHEYFHLYYFV
jgi:hypothetical protein